MDRPYLEVMNLVHQYNGRPVVDIERLAIKRGEIFAIIGPNGAGKSTLLRIINLLEKPFKGEVVFQGNIADSFLRRLSMRRKMTMVFQKPLLFDTTVFENVAYGLKIRKRPGVEIRTKVNNLLEKMNIAHLSKQPVSTLSGGEAQRVTLARALAIEPELFLLDEPFVSLDSPTKDLLQQDFYRAIKGIGLTTIYVTHDRTEALMVADRLAVMEKGHILQIGTPFEVYNYPVNESVASFVGVETILDGTIVAQWEGMATIQVDGGTMEAICDGEIGRHTMICIRPEEVILEMSHQPAPRESEKYTSARNKFEAVIVKIVNLGATVKVFLDCGFPLVGLVTKQSATELCLKENQKIWASIKATAIHVIEK